jgi:hypothetical protein
MGSSLLVVEYDDKRVRELDPEEILKVA